MADKSNIEWTEATWNPIVGCSIVSPGCTHCYAMKMAFRIEAMKSSHYDGTTKDSKGGAVWTGKVALAPEHILLQPLRWKRPRTIFVNSMGDPFHESVPDEWIDKVFATMVLAPQHTFQMLTKRSARMRAYMNAPDVAHRIYSIVCDLVNDGEVDGVLIPPGVDPKHAPPGRRIFLGKWPLQNLWIGVSTEDQPRADERIPDLLATPASVRFISAEPLLGPLNIRQWINDWGCGCGYGGDQTLDHCPNCGWVGEGPTVEFEGGDAPGDCPECRSALSDYYACPECKGTGQDGSEFGPNSAWLDWVIVGGESGPGARPMHPDWPRSLRDQCAAAGVPFFFKQWGEWLPGHHYTDELHGRDSGTFSRFACMDWDGDKAEETDANPGFDETGDHAMWRVGKKAAGRLLDGVEHNGMPTVESGTHPS